MSKLVELKMVESGFEPGSSRPQRLFPFLPFCVALFLVDLRLHSWELKGSLHRDAGLASNLPSCLEVSTLSVK